MKDVNNFVLNLYNNNGSFSYSPANRISNLYSTCFEVMCLDLINELDNFHDKDKVAKYIQSYQDKETGYFIDQTAIPKDNATHNQEYIFLQLTDFAQLALSALNKKPQHKYIFLNRYKDEKYLEKWFYDLNWKNPWLVSNSIMFILNCLIYEDEKENKKYINIIIDLLNKTQDSKNGYWNLGNKVTLHNQMAGAYHFIFFYTYLDFEPNHVEKIIDSTLKIQNYDRLFSYAGGGGSCDDLDAIDLLCRATLYTDFRKEDIRKALQKSYRALWNNQNKDRGFCWAKRERFDKKKIIFSINLKLLFGVSIFDFISNLKSKMVNQIEVLFFKNMLTWKFSGLNKMEIKLSDSDIFSTWFRLLAIALIEETFPEICNYKKTFNWNMRKRPGLGYHR